MWLFGVGKKIAPKEAGIVEVNNWATAGLRFRMPDFGDRRGIFGGFRRGRRPIVWP